MVALDPHHEPDVIYGSLEEFLARDDRQSRVIRINLQPVPLDFRYIARGSENLTVFFTAAVPKDSLAPRFTGFGISRTLNTNGLHFSDPSTALAPEVFLAWYTGSVRQPLAEVLPRIIAHYQSAAPRARTVLYGGSARAFASLVNGHRLPGSIAVVSNPQTDLRNYNTGLVRRWLKICWKTSGVDIPADLARVPPCTDLVSLYAQGSPNRVVYMQNAGDADHVAPHFVPFIEATRENPDVRFMLGDWGDGHKAPPKELIVHTLDMALTESWDSPAWSEAGFRTAHEYRRPFQDLERG